MFKKNAARVLGLFMVLLCILSAVSIMRFEIRAKSKVFKTIISINKTDDSSYECMVELAGIDMENLKGRFKDCPDVRYVICKCTKNYEVNAGVSIIVNQNEYLSKYIVRDEKTIELTCEHFF